MVRIKHRYLLLNILYPDNDTTKTANDAPGFLKFHAPTRHVDSQSFLAHLRSHIAASFGDQGLGLCLSSLKLIYFSNATSTAILRVPRAHYQIVWATLTYMTHMPAPRGRHATATTCVIRVVRVSGTIRKAEEELLRRSRQQIVLAKLSGSESQDSLLDKLVKAERALSTIPDGEDSNLSESEEAISSDSD